MDRKIQIALTIGRILLLAASVTSESSQAITVNLQSVDSTANEHPIELPGDGDISEKTQQQKGGYQEQELFNTGTGNRQQSNSSSGRHAPITIESFIRQPDPRIRLYKSSQGEKEDDEVLKSNPRYGLTQLDDTNGRSYAKTEKDDSDVTTHRFQEAATVRYQLPKTHDIGTGRRHYKQQQQQTQDNEESLYDANVPPLKPVLQGEHLNYHVQDAREPKEFRTLPTAQDLGLTGSAPSPLDFRPRQFSPASHQYIAYSPIAPYVKEANSQYQYQINSRYEEKTRPVEYYHPSFSSPVTAADQSPQQHRNQGPTAYHRYKDDSQVQIHGKGTRRTESSVDQQNGKTIYSEQGNGEASPEYNSYMYKRIYY